MTSSYQLETVQAATLDFPTQGFKVGPSDLVEELIMKRAKVISFALEETDWYLVEDRPSPKTKEPAELFMCPVSGCARQYLTKGKVAEHMKQRHNPAGTPRYQCQQPGCTMSYCRMDALRTHHRSESHQGLLVVYEVVTEESISKSTLQESKLECVALPPDERGTVRYRCAYSTCLKTYSTKYRCQAHVAASHISHIEKPFVCPNSDCQKSYTTRDSLNRHKRVTGHIGVSTRPSAEPLDTEIPNVGQEPGSQQPEKMNVETVDGQTHGKDEGMKTEGEPVLMMLPAVDLRSEYESTSQFHESVQELLSYFQELL